MSSVVSVGSVAYVSETETVERAKKGAGVVSQREGFGVGSKVYWAIERHTSPGKSVAAYGDVWDLEATTDDDAEVHGGSVLP